MTRIMYDAVDAAAIPAAAAMVAGYVDGDAPWTAADWALFPNAVQVRVAVNPATNDGHVLDVEPGNWDAAAAVPWIQMRREAGVEPTVYCGTWAPGYTWADVWAACDGAGVPRPQIWLANWDGMQTIPTGCVAKQYANDGGYDVSAVADYWPGVDPAPTPPMPDPNLPDVPSARSRNADAMGHAQALVNDLMQQAQDLNGTWPPGSPS